jgi:general secretion pathway protein L
MFLRLGDAPDQATVVAVDANGRLLHGPETMSLTAATERAGDMQITVLLPAAELVTCVAPLPAASPSRLRQMLPYSLEDEFAGDIDELHFAAGERNDDDQLAISVIARSRLDFWLEALRSAGVRPRRVCSEADAVPDTPGVVTLFLEGDKILGRRAGGAPFAFDELRLPELWHLLEGEGKDGDELQNVVLCVESATLQARRAEIADWQRAIAHVDIKELADGCLPRLASNLVFTVGTNLLQGPYATRSGYATLLRPWRFAAGFLLAFIAFGFAAKGAEVFKLSRDDRRLDAEIGEICAQAYSSPQLTSCRLEMQRRLADAGQSTTGGGLLAALAAVADAAGGTMRIENIDYRESVLTLQAVVPSVDYLDPFGRAIAENSAYAVSVDSVAGESAGGQTARLRIAPAAQ